MCPTLTLTTAQRLWHSAIAACIETIGAYAGNRSENHSTMYIAPAMIHRDQFRRPTCCQFLIFACAQHSARDRRSDSYSHTISQVLSLPSLAHSNDDQHSEPPTTNNEFRQLPLCGLFDSNFNRAHNFSAQTRQLIAQQHKMNT
jgi:hypothetical protein